MYMQGTSFIEILFGTLFVFLYSITILGLILVIIAENRNPLKTIPWVIVLLLVPGLGLIFYIWFGQDNRRQRFISRKTYRRIKKHPHTGKMQPDSCVVYEPYKELTILLNKTKDAPLLYGSDLKI